MTNIDQLLSYNVYQALIGAASPSPSNVYLTQSGGLANLLTGYVLGTNTPLSATNSVLTAFENLQAQFNTVSTIYVPYSGATGTVDLNNQTLTDIKNLGVGVVSVPNFITATGIQPASVATSTGTSATSVGAIDFTSAQGGNTTITTTGTGGGGGNVNIISGQGGTASSAVTSSTGGVSGNVVLSSGSGASAILSGASNTGGGSGSLNIASSNGGGASQGTVNLGGNAGPIMIITGGGGAAGAIVSGGTNATGGNAGNFSTIGGAGGNATHASVASIGGTGATISFTAGNGGNAANATSNAGGNGGGVTFTAGRGGTGSTLNGTNGQIIFNADNVNSMYIGNGSTGAIGIGTSSPTVALHINSASSPAFRLVDTTQASGRVLTSDANGNASWQVVSAGEVTLTTNHILVGNASNIATDVAMSGDATIVASGALTVASTIVKTVVLNTPNVLYTTPVTFTTTSNTATGTLTLNTQTANTIFAGPTSGGAATPTFRVLVSADIPSLSSIYVPYTGASSSVNLNAQTLVNVSSLGIGTASPTTQLQVITTTSSTPRGILLDHYTNDTTGSRMTQRKSRGTPSSPTTIVTGDALASWTSSGYDGTNFVDAGKMLVTSIGTVSTGIVPTTMQLMTMTAGGTLTTGITIDQSQNTTLAGTANNVGTITTGTWNGSVIGLAYGGTNANLTASNGGIFYSTASAGAILAGTATANRVLMSGSSTTPSWSTNTYPVTDATGDLHYASSTNTISGLAIGSTGQFLTVTSGLPAWTTGSLIQTASVTLTSAQVLLLTTTPIQIVAAPGAGKYIFVLSAQVYVNYNSTTYSGTITLTEGGNVAICSSTQALGATVSRTLLLPFNSAILSSTSTMYITNAALNISATMNPTTGNSPVTVYVQYVIMTQ